MTSNVQITLTSTNFPAVTPIGAIVNYGINKIPTALVPLDPSSLKLLCNFDQYRRTKVQLNIETTNGCLHFPGLVDGLSFSQTPGGLTATLVLKHEFQWLTELYPRIIGFAPTTNNIFRPNTTLKIDWGNAARSEMMSQIQQYGLNLNFDANLVDFYINTLQVAVQSQNITQITNQDGTTLGLQTVLADSDISRKNLRAYVLGLLRKINTSATAALNIKASSSKIADQVLQDMAMMRDNIFSNLTRLLGTIGCCIVIGNTQAFVVPEASYLLVPKIDSLQRGKTATRPNIIFPAEYDHVSFNDNGFVNIKGVYVIADQGAKIAGSGPAAVVDMGYYSDPNPNANGNITVETLPTLVSYGLVEASVQGGAGLQPRIKQNKSLLGKQLTHGQVSLAVNSSNAKTYDSWAQRLIFMQQWAEMEYCKLKYDDRTGNINTYFRNNWAPGAAGTLYTRQPGTFIDFFVTDVVHNFTMSPPNSGTATTSISFKSGRMGTTTGTGIDTLQLYKYNYASAQSFSQLFINDIK